MSLVLIAALCTLTAILWSKLFPTIKKYLHLYELGSKLPGPPAIPILGNSLQMPTSEFEMNAYFTEMTKTCVAQGNRIVRFWFAHVLGVMPLEGETVKAIVDSSEELDKSSDYDIMVPWLGDGLLLSTGEKWRRQRRMLTPTFHFSMLDSYVTAMDRNARILTEIIDKSADSGEILDLFPLFKRCTLDVICETAMGHELNSLTNDRHPYAEAVGRMGTISVEYGFNPLYWTLLGRKITGFQKEYEDLLKTLKAFTENVIQERILSRKEEGEYSETKRKAFLDMLLDMQEENSMTQEEIREQVDTFMLAGHETTSTAVSWTIWALATHPEIQERVAKEVIDVTGDADCVTLNEIKAMPYLEMVLKESMRVNPPVGMVGRHLRNDLKMGDHLVPAGTNIFIAPLMIHRNPKIYPEPLRFDPDRFLPENLKQRHSYDFIPFSAGPRNCIGQKFAMYEAKIILSWLLRKFKFSTDKKFLDNDGVTGIVTSPALGVPVEIRRRV